MANKKIKDIFHYQREEASRTVRWFFGLPFAYTLYILISLVIPVFGTTYVLVNVRNILSYGALLFCFVFVVRRFIRADIKMLVSESGLFDFRKLFTGFAVMLFMVLATSFIWMAIEPENFEFTLCENPVLDWSVSLILLCLSALTEELIYRGYIVHFLSDSLETNRKKQLIYCLVSGLLFTVAHFLNPELKINFIIPSIFYFIMGFSLMGMYFTTGGMEFPLGVHLANNLCAAWFFTYPGSVISTTSLFTNLGGISVLTLVQAVVCLTVSTFVARKLPC